MKFRTRLMAYYLIATLVSVFFVGFAVLEGIDRLNMQTMEQQLIGESRLAEIYVLQAALLDNPQPEVLSGETATRAIGDLGLILGNVRLYDKSFTLLASSKDGTGDGVTKDENIKILSNALKGNYAYLVRGNTAYFASPLNFRDKTLGLLEIVYPMDLLSNLTRGVTKILLAGAVLFAVIVSLLSVYIAGRMAKPVRRLAAAADRYANREFSPVEVRGSDEIAQLGRSFNAMGDQLKDYIQRQKQFVSNVSHELRTPLTAIKGYSEYLKDEVGDNPDLQKAVYHLNNESERLTKLVDELLTLSRIDSGREDFVLERLDFSRLVEEAAEKMLLRCEKYGIRMSRNINPGIQVSGDRGKLFQVLMNLLDNAVKFSPAGSTLWVGLCREDNWACLTIADEGIGIQEAEAEKVFERFYRAKNAGGIPGTGLGLSIVKEIVEAHQGAIELRPASGGGTIASLRLPVL